MDKPDDQQQQVAPQTEPNRPPAFRLGPIGEDDDAGAKEEREHRHRLLIDKDFAGDADGPVEPGVGSGIVKVEEGRLGEPERDGIHHENAERCETANGVEISDAFGLADWSVDVGHMRLSPIHLGS